MVAAIAAAVVVSVVLLYTSQYKCTPNSVLHSCNALRHFNSGTYKSKRTHTHPHRHIAHTNRNWWNTHKCKNDCIKHNQFASLVWTFACYSFLVRIVYGSRDYFHFCWKFAEHLFRLYRKWNFIMSSFGGVENDRLNRLRCRVCLARFSWVATTFHICSSLPEVGEIKNALELAPSYHLFPQSPLI